MYTPYISTGCRRCLSNSRCAGRWRWAKLRDTQQGRNRVSFQMHLEAEIEWTPRCASRTWSSEFRDVLEDQDRVNSQIHSDAVMEWVWRCTCMPWSSKFWDAIGNQDQVNLEMHLQAMIKQVWRCTCRLWSNKIDEELGGRHTAGGQWETCRSAETLFLGYLTRNRGNVTRLLYLSSSYVIQNWLVAVDL